MNVSPVNFDVATKAPAFKGAEKAKEEKSNSSQDLVAIKESIDKNTKALDQIGKMIYASLLASSKKSDSEFETAASSAASLYERAKECGGF